MSKFASTSPESRRLSPLSIAAVLILYGLAESASAAGINGQVLDGEGSALANTPVCLKRPGADRECLDIQLTDRYGEYRFRGRKLTREYAIEIFRDDQASTRRYSSYGSYSWSPKQQTATLIDREQELQLEPFVGRFDFRNFQRVIHLAADDFPELAEFDLANEYVVLKVSHAPGVALQPPNIIFLGQVTNAGRISLEASVPSATEAIDYEIYTAHHAASGRIQLADQRIKPGRKPRDIQSEEWGKR